MKGRQKKSHEVAEFQRRVLKERRGEGGLVSMRSLSNGSIESDFHLALRRSFSSPRC